MYRLVKIKTKIKVPPTKFNLPLKQAVKESLAETYEGLLDRRFGIGLMVTNIEEIGEGKILPEDPSIHYPVTFELLVFKPELHEVVAGDVIDITEFGAFVRIGALDGLVHVSQVLDDFVSYDEKNAMFLGKETKKTLKDGDSVLARVISISFGGGKETKIGLTMRQPGLGAFHWIEQDKKAASKSKK
ncbi:MAG: DNA-directed RNA polymerase [Candidatus Aenigmatarchaeota archaeon]